MKTKIKVTNTKLGVCTFWSIVKFEDKLMQMRDLYQVILFHVNKICQKGDNSNLFVISYLVLIVSVAWVGFF